MVYGALLAGGVGNRMKFGDVPKQFLELSGKAIFIHTLEKMYYNNRLDLIIVGIHSDWMELARDLIQKANLDDSRVKVVSGGTDRNETIMQVISYIRDSYGIRPDDVIVTHDAVRPFVTNRILNENIDAALRYGACDTAIAAYDTIVHSTGGDFISDIPPRHEFYLGQTPQSFNINLFCECYHSLSDELKQILTDACSVCVKAGKPVFIVRGETLNFKITTVSDYQMAQAMLHVQDDEK